MARPSRSVSLGLQPQRKRPSKTSMRKRRWLHKPMTRFEADPTRPRILPTEPGPVVDWCHSGGAPRLLPVNILGAGPLLLPTRPFEVDYRASHGLGVL